MKHIELTEAILKQNKEAAILKAQSLCTGSVEYSAYGKKGFCTWKLDNNTQDVLSIRVCKYTDNSIFTLKDPVVELASSVAILVA